jgi:anti-sigma regulatory factor (Ser/Thr protein kinase)
MERCWEFDSRDPSTVTTARHYLTSYLHDHAETGADCEAAELILGELLANAIKYGREPIQVRIASGERGAVLTVEDCGEGFRVDRLALAEPLAPGGRGVALATAFARSLRVDCVKKDGGRFRVTVELPLRLTATGES